MADVHSKKTRSYNMSRIRGKDSKPEMMVRKFLYRKGLRYRIHQRQLPGSPDIVFKKLRIAIFVHGCFWHAHRDCPYFRLPKSNQDFWRNKLEQNHINDISNAAALKNDGWKVITVWECELKKDKREDTLGSLLNTIISFRQ